MTRLLTLSVIAALFATFAASRARADEGLERITELGDREIVSPEKRKPAKPKGETYKAVEPEDDRSSSNLFKGEPVKHGNDIFFGLGTGFYGGFGLQARYSARVIEKGPVAGINNSLNLEGGLGVTFYGSQSDGNTATGFGFLAAARWDFQMDESWIFFGEAGLGVSAVSNSESGNVRGGSVFPVVGVGAMYNVSPEWAVRADVGYEFTGIGAVYRF